MKHLKKGTEPNQLELLVDNIDIKPSSQMKNGMIEDGMIIKIHRFNLDNLLTQLLEDYGEEALIKRIQAID